MHSDDAHGKKGGFFSKIFGHDDDQADPKTDSNPNVIHPEDAKAVGVADMVTNGVTATQTNPMPSLPDTPAALPVSPTDADITSGSMSDVHAIPKSDHEPINLNMTGNETTPAVASPSADDETKAEAAVDVELDASKALDEASPAVNPASPVNTPSASEEDPDLAALKAAQAAHGGGETTDIESSTGRAPEISAMSTGTPPTEPDNDANTFNIHEIASSPITPPPSEETAQSDQTSSPSQPDSPSASTESTEPTESMAVSPVDETPTNPVASDVEPPAPPVQEGETWSATQPSFTDSISKSSLDANADPAPAPDSTASQASSNDPVSAVETEANKLSADAQSEVSGILANRQDFTTDSQADQTSLDPTTPIAEDIALAADAKPDAALAESAETDPELKAGLLRLEQHIDDLDSGLQKVRDELASLKSKI